MLASEECTQGTPLYVDTSVQPRPGDPSSKMSRPGSLCSAAQNTGANVVSEGPAESGVLSGVLRQK